MASAMDGVDTNVLVRILTQDDPDQAARAGELIRSAERAGDRLRVSAIVLCEVVWVLRSAYGYPKDDVVRALRLLLSTSGLAVEDADEARAAVAEYAAGGGDFADYYLGRRNLSAGCGTTFTLDGGLEGSRSFTVL